MSVLDEDSPEGRELNDLQTRYGMLERRKDALRKQVIPINKELTELNAEIQRLGTRISQLKHGKKQLPHITDHAVVRYMQRVEGMDIDEIRSKIAGHPKAHMHENVIITVLGENPEDQEI
jgi:uncharacterized protein YydD (DUF2326 family)